VPHNLKSSCGSRCLLAVQAVHPPVTWNAPDPGAREWHASMTRPTHIHTAYACSGITGHKLNWNSRAQAHRVNCLDGLQKSPTARGAAC
jgi:hypothetical protein